MRTKTFSPPFQEGAKLNFQPKNDRTKIYFISVKLIWLISLCDRDTIYNL